MSRRYCAVVVADLPDRLVLSDVGPHDRYMTITNAAEDVVAEYAPQLNGRRLVYFDSENELTELVVAEGRFAGFRFPKDLQ